VTRLPTHRMLVLGVAALVAVTTGACSVKSSTKGGGKEEITFLTFETPNLTPKYWDAAIKRVTDKYPDIKVHKLVSPSVDRTGYAKQLLASGQFPDVMIAVTPAGFAESGQLYAWKQSELKDFVFPKAGMIKGKIYQLPANSQTIPNVYYNKKQWADAGITGTPTTYQELLDDSAKLAAKGFTPFTIGGGKDGFPSELAWTGLVSTDVYRKTPDFLTKRRAGSVKFTDPGFEAATQKFADLAAKGYLNKADVSRSYADTEQAFLDGKGAMYPMGSWFAAAADTKKHDFDIGVFPWPTGDGKLVMPTYTGGGLLVSAHAKHLDAARKFALAFQLDKNNLDNSVHSDALFPAIKGYTPPSNTGPVFKATFDLYKKAVARKAIVNAFAWETGDDGLLPGMTDKVYASAQDLITGRKNVQQVCSYLDDEWTKAS
jgi:ABC-type glycerol-3-phosphate transport system substrate-binding protein